MGSEKQESASGDAVSMLVAPLVFGGVVMMVSALIVFGTTMDLESQWDKALKRDGYGTADKIRERQQDQAAFPAELTAWQAREALRAETAKAKLAPDAEEGALERELQSLREAADDSEPNKPLDPPRPLPEGLWARFVALSTSSRTKLFAGSMVAPVPFMVGLVVALAGLVAFFREGSGRRVARQFPDRPWLHLAKWAALQGDSSTGGSSIGILVMLGVFGWVAFCVTGLWVLEPAPGGGFTFMMCIANFVAAFIAVLAVRRLLAAFKFGEARLLLAQVPAEPGKNFAMRLMVPAALSKAEKLEATLRLEKITTSGSGKKQQTHQVTLFERELVVPRSAFVEQDGRLSIELRFDIPDDQPITRYLDEPHYRWWVDVHAATPGTDFEDTFELPVYNVGPGHQPLVRTEWS